MKKHEEIKKVKDDPTCFECNHYEVCQMWSNAGYLHKDNPKKCSHFAGRSSERRKISTLQTIVDEQDKVIQQLEAQVPRWISVDERMPESEKPVLAVVQTNSSPVFKRITVLEHINAHEVNTEDNFDWHEYEGDTEYDAENDCYWIPECWYEVNVVDDNPNWMLDDWWRVTHWMPLPEAPKEDAK